jgi:hypothetical protein
MDRVQELISVLSDNDVIKRTPIAKAHQCCKICGKPAKSFKTELSALEYSISGICQSCQDYYFGDCDHTSGTNQKSACKLLADGVSKFTYPN